MDGFDGSVPWNSIGESWRHKNYPTLDPSLDLVSEWREPIQVKLNDSYTAEIDGNLVKVGCQTFPVEVIEELAEAARKCRA